MGKQLKKTEGLFNTQWGRLMESLVEGDLLTILNQQGIQMKTPPPMSNKEAGRQL